MQVLTACLSESGPISNKEHLNGPFHPIPNTFTSTTASPVGLWIYTFPFYSSQIDIRQDGTFSYHAQGCLGLSYTAGTWDLSGSKVILSSDDRYKNYNMLKTLRVEPKNSSERHVDLEDTETLEISPQFEILTASMDLSDTAYLEFNETTYQLIGNDLHRLEEHGIKTDVVYKLKGGSY